MRLHHLLILKASIKQVSLSIMQDKSRESTVSPEDRLGITVACIRAVEEVNVNKVVHCCRKYPEPSGLINPEDPNIRSSASYTALKDHAVQLARADVQDDVEDLCLVIAMMTKLTFRKKNMSWRSCADCVLVSPTR